jgi:hypothetical protein
VLHISLLGTRIAIGTMSYDLGLELVSPLDRLPMYLNITRPAASTSGEKDKPRIRPAPIVSLNHDAILSLQTSATAPLNVETEKTKKKMDDTAGSQWFNMRSTPMTPEIKQDLAILQLRDALDPKQFYRRERPASTGGGNGKATGLGISKHFQIGKIVEGPHEFYSSRIPRSQRAPTLADELIRDTDKRKEIKRRYLTNAPKVSRKTGAKKK